MHGEEDEALIELKMILAAIHHWIELLCVKDFLKKGLPYLGQTSS